MRLSLRSLALALPLVATLGASGLHCAYADTTAQPPSRAPNADPGAPAPAPTGLHIELVDEGSADLPTYLQSGRRFVLGQLGQRYRIRIVNPTGSRVEAVVSVDGLDAIDGKPANLNKRGYLVGPYDSVVVDGFRTSLDSVATFRFSSVHDSYADRTGHPRNVGVVGVAFFRERPPPPPPPVARVAPPHRVAPDAPRAAPSPAPAAEGAGAASESRRASSAPADDSLSNDRPGLGTQFGEARESHVMEVAFVRADRGPVAVSELRYDDRDGLLARGIQLDPPWRDPREVENDLRDSAQAFPTSRFAQPPP